jgi:hypothetical protein
MGVTYIVYKVEYVLSEYRVFEQEKQVEYFSFNPNLSYGPIGNDYEWFAKVLDVEPIQVRNIEIIQE